MARIVDADLFRTKPSVRSTGGSDGGNMDDVVRRLGAVESLLDETREGVRAIKAARAHLATKAELNDLTADVNASKATRPHLGTKADVNEVKPGINAGKADIHGLEAEMIRWIDGTTIPAISVAFTIAKWV